MIFIQLSTLPLFLQILNSGRVFILNIVWRFIQLQ